MTNQKRYVKIKAYQTSQLNWQERKGSAIKKTIEEIETIETISEEFVEIQEIEQGKPMYTISRDMVVVETTKDFSNPLSYDRDALKLFLENNRELLKEYHNSEDNFALSFYACGYNGTAQNEFAQAWADSGVMVF